MANESGSRMAAALRYQQGKSAPQVVAKGRGFIADEIVRHAREAGIALHESPQLAALLMEVNLDQPIPPQLYRVVAELLAWVYGLESRSKTAVLPQNPSLVMPSLSDAGDE